MADTLNVYKDGELIKSEDYVDGKATITIDGLEANTNYSKGAYQVSRKNENGESSKVDVPAFKTKPIAVTGVTVSPETATVEVGGTTKISSSVTPSTATNKKVSYSTSDEAVATVTNSGTVTGVSEGEATITVTTEDGNKTATSAVTVNAATE